MNFELNTLLKRALNFEFLSVDEGVFLFKNAAAAAAAGSPNRFTSKGIQESIIEAGFQPQLRTQKYESRELPENTVEQIINY